MRLLLNIPRRGQHFHPPLWRQQGFDSENDSLIWSDRACGIACAAMVLDFFAHPHVATHDLLHQARSLGAYSPHGWIHARLAHLLEEHGVPAEALPVPPAALGGFLCDALASGPVIASVTLSLPVDGRRGGHLVLITGIEPALESGGEPTPTDEPTVHFNDPSRWGETHRTSGLTRFAASFSGRVIRTEGHPANPPRA